MSVAAASMTCPTGGGASGVAGATGAGASGVAGARAGGALGTRPLGTQDAPTPSRGRLALSVTLSVAAISTAAIFIRLADAPPLAIAFYRLLDATLILGVWACLFRRDDLRTLSRRDIMPLMGVGAILALHFATWITSLSLTSVASSVFLVTLHPVFVALASHRLYGEGVSRVGFIGILVALVGGAAITLGDASARNSGANPLLGDVLALVGAGAAAVYFLAGRGFRRRLPLMAYVLPVYASSTLVLGILLVALPAPWGGAVRGYAAPEQLLFLALAIVPMIMGHTLLNWALRHVTAPVIATTILGEPIGSSILALIILKEAPPTTTLAGGLIVLAGIAAVALTTPTTKSA